MVLLESRVIKVELFDDFSARSRQYFSRHELHSLQVILAQFKLRIKDSSQIRLCRHLKDDDVSLRQGCLDVELADLGDLGDQVAHFYVVVDFQGDAHRLIIVDIIVALCELSKMLSVSVTLTTLHPL